MPPLSIPDLSLLREIAPAAFAVTLLGLTEAVSIGRSIALKSGLSNIAASFFSSYVASGSFNRSGLNYESGARTPVAAMLWAPLLAAILLRCPRLDSAICRCCQVRIVDECQERLPSGELRQAPTALFTAAAASKPGA